MKKNHNDRRSDELRPEYDPALFKAGVRGKYAKREKKNVHVILLEPDVATAFPDAESVNSALRMLMNVAKSATK